MRFLDLDGLKRFWKEGVKPLLDNKVDKELKTDSTTDYKVLSDNNYTDEEKEKLSTLYKVHYPSMTQDTYNAKLSLGEIQDDVIYLIEEDDQDV